MVEVSEEQAREIQGSKKAKELSRTLLNISNAVSITKDLKELYQTIHRILGETINLTNFYIALYYKDTGTIVFPYYVDEYDARDESEKLFSEDGSLTGSVIKRGKPLFLNQEELRLREGKQKIVGTTPVVWLGIPLNIGDEVIGVIATQSYDDPECFSEIDRNILISVSDQVALAIERKRNEQALITNEKKYRNIIETIEDSYYELNLNREFSLINKAGCKLLEVAEKELLGKNVRQFMSRYTYRRLLRYLKKVLDGSKTGFPIEMELITPNKKRLYIETIISPIYNDRGSLQGARGIARDVTQRVEAERIKHELEEKLQQSQRLESLGTLAGGIAHDFNNLLMGIQGRTAVLKHDYKDDSLLVHHLDEIDEYVNSAASLTTRLLGFARGGKYELKPLDINELIEKSVQMFGRTKKELLLSTVLKDNLPAIEADGHQIDQVLLNLLVNSSQAMGPEGGTITIATRQLEMDEEHASFHDLEPGVYVQTIISDTGEGIEPDILANIFDPFFTTKSLGHGSGLGLAMVYGIIRNHGGAISVESTVGKGTTFTILLPASNKAIQTRKTPLQHHPATGKETILLVDDEDLITTVGSEMLKVLDYQVFTANTGQEAIDLYKENMASIDLVIIDMIMPQMSGGVLFDHLMAINPDAKIILSSGYTVDGAARKILDRGCKGFIQKPFDLAGISNKIREVLA